MNIYVARNQQKYGPYTLAEVRARMASGQVAETDVGWHDGMPCWVPLSQLLSSLSVGPDGSPPIPRRSSGLAKASFIIGVVGIAAWFLLVGAAAVGVAAGVRDTSPLMVILGLFMFAGMAANLAGATFGIVALVKSISNRWMAIAGVLTNGLELLGMLFLMLLGSE